MINEYDIVRLKRNIPEKNLHIGDEGTIVMIHDIRGLPRGYEVEFYDNEGYMSAVLTLMDEDIEEIV
jgi:hypothetical protein